jgi:outer membrane protein
MNLIQTALSQQLHQRPTTVVNILIIFLFGFCVNTTNAQDVWTLERCVNYAKENNKTVKQAIIGTANAKLTKQQSEYNRYPSLSANGNYGLNFGRSVDPGTYTFQNTSTSNNSWSLNANVTLYNGGRITNTIKQNDLDAQAAEADAEQTANNVALSIAQAYLQILLNEEQVENANKRLKQAQDQLARTERQIKAGSLAQNSRLDVLATIAKNEQNLGLATNNVEIAYLNLKQLLYLEPDYALKIEKPSITAPTENPESFVLKSIYNQALGNQAQIRAGELRLKSAELNIDIAKAGMLPSLNANGSIGTNYSSQILDYSKAQYNIQDGPTQTIKVNGTPVPVIFPQQTLANPIPQKAYGSQLGDNLGQSLGLSLHIPIFDNMRNKINIEKAKLNIENQTINNDKAKQQLKSDIQNAIASARAAKSTYLSAQKTYDAQKAAYENTEKRFQIGGVSTFEYTTAKSLMDTAETDWTVSKYDYLFKLKIVEYYQGKKLSLK